MYALVDPRPRWEELVAAAGDRPAVEVQFPALPSARAFRKASEATLAVYVAAGRSPDEVQAAAGQGDADALDIMIQAGEAFSRELVRWSILDWRGIGDATGNPVAPEHDIVTIDPETGERHVEPRTISAFLAERTLMAAADAKFVLPWSKRDAEKNGYAASPNGISDQATAVPDTAETPATPPTMGDAEPAPIDASSISKPKRPKKSGG